VSLELRAAADALLFHSVAGSWGEHGPVKVVGFAMSS